MTSSTPTQIIWNKIRNIKSIKNNTGINTLNNTDRKQITTNKDLAKLITTTFARNFCTNNYNNQFQACKIAKESGALKSVHRKKTAKLNDPLSMN